MTETTKHAVRLDRRRMSGNEVARRYGITRQRVHQILQEVPDAGLLEAERTRGLTPKLADKVIVRFAKKALLHLNDADVQRAICCETAIYPKLAEKYNATYHAIQRIRLETDTGHGPGRPRAAQFDKKFGSRA